MHLVGFIVRNQFLLLVLQIFPFYCVLNIMVHVSVNNNITSTIIDVTSGQRKKII